MRFRFFAAFLGLLCLSGCRKPEAAPRDRFRTQLSLEAYDALAAGRTDRALKLLHRLQDIYPQHSFYALAIAHERSRAAIGAFNGLLRDGRQAPALRYAREQLAQGTLVAGFDEAEPLATSLIATAEYLEKLPFPDSESASAALNGLEKHRAALAKSTRFSEWWAGQQAVLEHIRAAERAVVLRQLLASLDLALVTEDPVAEILLAQAEALAPEGILARALAAGLTGRWDELPQLMQDVGREWQGASSLEAAMCYNWPPPAHCLEGALQNALEDLQVNSFSGLLLRLLVAAETGDLEGAVSFARDLAGLTAIGPTFCRYLLETNALPRQQFAASCWRSPFPGVSDYVNRITQLREHRQGE